MLFIVAEAARDALWSIIMLCLLLGRTSTVGAQEVYMYVRYRKGTEKEDQSVIYRTLGHFGDWRSTDRFALGC